jgi:hypothetical protein
MFEFYAISAPICGFLVVTLFIISLTEGFFNKVKYWLLAALIFVASAVVNFQYEAKEVKLSTPDSYVLNEKTGTSYFMFGTDSRTSHWAAHYLSPSNVVLKTTITTTGKWVKDVDSDGGVLVIKELE